MWQQQARHCSGCPKFGTHTYTPEIVHVDRYMSTAVNLELSGVCGKLIRDVNWTMSRMQIFLLVADGNLPWRNVNWMM